MSIDLIRPDLVGIPTYLSSSTQGKIRLHINESPWAPTDASSVALTRIVHADLFREQGNQVSDAWSSHSSSGSVNVESSYQSASFALSHQASQLSGDHQHEIFEFNRYPDSAPQLQLEEELASVYGVAPGELLLTRSADEGIDFLMRLFLRPALDSIMQFPPTFSMYAFYARLQQAAVISCPLEESDFRLNRELLSQLWQPHCKIIMLCSPNNPTGNLLDLETVASLCQEFEHRSIIVVDEAYVEFANTRSAATLINSFDNLLVLRTLSKAHGLAGLRLGSVIGSAPLIQSLRTIVPPFIFSNLILETASRVLKNKLWVKTAVENIVIFREELVAYLKTFSWVEKIYPSKANFILIKTKHALCVSSWLDQHSILVRHFTGNLLMQDKLRITIGDAVQNKSLRAALDSFRPNL